MDEQGYTDVDDVLDTIQARVREHGIPTAVALVVEFVDMETGQEMLWVHRDTRTAMWKHYGMAQSMVDDFRSAMQNLEERSD